MTELSTAVPQPQKHPGGRPRLSFDLRLGEGLGKIQSTHRELAAVLGSHLGHTGSQLFPHICSGCA